MLAYSNDNPGRTNRRFSRRVPCRLRATVQLTTTQARCIIRDRSIGGMRLVFAERTKLEPEFTVVQSGGQTRAVRLVWTDDLQAGVTFVPDPPSAARP